MKVGKIDRAHYALREGDNRFCKLQADEGGECYHDDEVDSFGLDLCYDVGRGFNENSYIIFLGVKMLLYRSWKYPK